MWIVSPGRKRTARPRTRHLLLALAHEMHLDAAEAGVVERLVTERRAGRSRRSSSRLMRARRFRLKRAVTPCASLYAACRRAGSFFRSTPIRSPPPAPGHRARVLQESRRLRRREVADGRAGKVDDAPARAHAVQVRQGERPRIVGAHRDDREAGKIPGERSRGSPQLRGGDVDGEVGHRRECLDEDARLAAAAAAVLDQRAPRPEALRHVARVRAHDRDLGARRIVLGQLADRVEQRAARLVVEILGRQRLLRPRQAVQHVVEEAAGIRTQIVKGYARDARRHCRLFFRACGTGQGFSRPAPAGSRSVAHAAPVSSRAAGGAGSRSTS